MLQFNNQHELEEYVVNHKDKLPDMFVYENLVLTKRDSNEYSDDFDEITIKIDEDGRVFIYDELNDNDNEFLL